MHHRLRLLWFLLVSSSGLQAQLGIATLSHGGRLGDQLLQYCAGEWLAYSNNASLYYTPFALSNSLMLSAMSTPYSAAIDKKYARAYKKKRGDSLCLQDGNVLYQMNYPYAYYTVLPTINWQDKKFRQRIRDALTPCCAPDPIAIPDDVVSVAVHVRKGSGKDLPLLHGTNGSGKKYSDVIWPLKFPPDEYYLEMIQILADLFNDRQLYVYIFTDAQRPERLVEKYQSLVNRTNVSFACRDVSNGSFPGIVEDFYCMQAFDCLIRSGSNFSWAVEKAAAFAVSCYPTHLQWESHSTLVVTDATIMINHAHTLLENPRNFSAIQSSMSITLGDDTIR